MHKTSLNRTIIDYLTGHEIEETTFEELRQGIARMLVEAKQYPREAICPKLTRIFSPGPDTFTATIDFAVFLAGQPWLAIYFCAGSIGTFIRQNLALSRIWLPPFPLTLVTDSRNAQLLTTADGQLVCEGYNAFPSWLSLGQITAPPVALTPQQREIETRITSAYINLGCGCGG